VLYNLWFETPTMSGFIVAEKEESIEQVAESPMVTQRKRRAASFSLVDAQRLRALLNYSGTASIFAPIE
jgi:hypothetical protein